MVHTFVCKSCLLLQRTLLVALNGLLVFGYDKSLSTRTGRHRHSLPPRHAVEFLVFASNTDFFIVSIDRGCSRLLPETPTRGFLKYVFCHPLFALTRASWLLTHIRNVLVRTSAATPTIQSRQVFVWGCFSSVVPDKYRNSDYYYYQ